MISSNLLWERNSARNPLTPFLRVFSTNPCTSFLHSAALWPREPRRRADIVVLFLNRHDEGSVQRCIDYPLWLSSPSVWLRSSLSAWIETVFSNTNVLKIVQTFRFSLDIFSSTVSCFLFFFPIIFYTIAKSLQDKPTDGHEHSLLIARLLHNTSSL